MAVGVVGADCAVVCDGVLLADDGDAAECGAVWGDGGGVSGDELVS